MYRYIILRPSLFWDITQRTVVISCRRYGQMICPVFMTLEHGTDRLSRNVDKELSLYAA